MKRIITITLLLTSILSFSKETQTEFEGVIHYKKTVTRLSDNKKAISYAKYAMESLGDKSDFTTKMVITYGIDFHLKEKNYYRINQNIYTLKKMLNTKIGEKQVWQNPMKRSRA